MKCFRDFPPGIVWDILLAMQKSPYFLILSYFLPDMTLSSILFIRIDFKLAFKIENSQSTKICYQWRHLKESEVGLEGNLERRVPKIFGNIIEINAWLPDVTTLKIKFFFDA